MSICTWHFTATLQGNFSLRCGTHSKGLQNRLHRSKGLDAASRMAGTMRACTPFAIRNSLTQAQWAGASQAFFPCERWSNYSLSVPPPKQSTIAKLWDAKDLRLKGLGVIKLDAPCRQPAQQQHLQTLGTDDAANVVTSCTCTTHPMSQSPR